MKKYFYISIGWLFLVSSVVFGVLMGFNELGLSLAIASLVYFTIDDLKKLEEKVK